MEINNKIEANDVLKACIINGNLTNIQKIQNEIINNANLNKNTIKTFNDIEILITEEITSEKIEKTISNIKIENIEEKKYEIDSIER